MPGCADRYEELCRGRFDHLDEMMERVDTSIRGNDETPGINVRLDRVEMAQARWLRLVWIIVGTALATSGAALIKLVVG